jgi:AbrB family looped-hinge helix DNA binding protein
MRAETKLTSKGQVVIPKGVRDRLRWRPGTRLRIETLGNGGIKLDVVRVDGGALDPIDRAFGILRGESLLLELEREHREEVEEDERRRRR